MSSTHKISHGKSGGSSTMMEGVKVSAAERVQEANYKSYKAKTIHRDRTVQTFNVRCLDPLSTITVDHLLISAPLTADDQPYERSKSNPSLPPDIFDKVMEIYISENGTNKAFKSLVGVNREFYADLSPKVYTTLKFTFEKVFAIDNQIKLLSGVVSTADQNYVRIRMLYSCVTTIVIEDFIAVTAIRRLIKAFERLSHGSPFPFPNVKKISFGHPLCKAIWHRVEHANGYRDVKTIIEMFTRYFDPEDLCLYAFNEKGDCWEVKSSYRKIISDLFRMLLKDWTLKSVISHGCCEGYDIETDCYRYVGRDFTYPYPTEGSFPATSQMELFGMAWDLISQESRYGGCMSSNVLLLW